MDFLPIYFSPCVLSIEEHYSFFRICLFDSELKQCLFYLNGLNALGHAVVYEYDFRGNKTYEGDTTRWLYDDATGRL